MPKVSEEYRSAQKSKIASAALRAFGRKGFQATSMADIITESGMSAGAIYAYFPGKAEIIVDVASRVLGRRIANLESATSNKLLLPPSEVVRAILTGLKEEIGNPSVIPQVWGEAVVDAALRSLANNAFSGLQNALTRYLQNWSVQEHEMDADTAAKRARELAPLLVSVCQGYILQLALVDDFDSDFYLNRVIENLPR
ncbi:MAG: TetR/AcrR family transcriptional regulator [Microbacteriaceae bacterium]|nr:TetR/AcrR family transcriptional regulator [Cryobacterium sp.]MCC6376369.1 TetR/AcrR family transcriptional regulator [Microbacteriaceae bacterium]